MKRDKLLAVISAVLILVAMLAVLMLPGPGPEYGCCMQACEKAENMEEFMAFSGVSIPAKMNCEDYCRTIAGKFEGAFFDEEIRECREPFSLGGLA